MGAFVYRLEHERERACASVCGLASRRRNPPGAPCGMGAQAPTKEPRRNRARFYVLAFL
jgi:hypothetical protein